jgi:ribosomal protein S18 acetylase RimI-like enzyme
VLFLATEQDETVGLGAAYFNDPSGRQGFLSLLVVRENYRRLGIGARLLQMAIDYGAQRGFQNLRLEVERDNLAAQALYQVAGFKPEPQSVTPHFLGMARPLNRRAD